VAREAVVVLEYRCLSAASSYRIAVGLVLVRQGLWPPLCR